MKAFSLEEYLKNQKRKVVTRNGRSARIICTDAKGNYPIVVLIEEGGYDNALSYTKDGKLYVGETNDYDLFFAPEKHEGYACVHFNDGIYYLNDTLFSSKEEAYVESKKWGDFVATVKIEWEE